MTAPIYRFRRVRDVLRSKLGDTGEIKKWRDDELDDVIAACMDRGSGTYSFAYRMAGYYNCPALGGDNNDSDLLVMVEEDKASPAPFSGQNDCIYEISCNGNIRVKGTGTETAASLDVVGCPVNWQRVYDALLDIIEGRKVNESQVSSGDGSYSPPEEFRIRNYREYMKGAR